MSSKISNKAVSFSAARLSYHENKQLETALEEPVLNFMPHELFSKRNAYEFIFIKSPALPSSNVDWYLPGFDRIGDAASYTPKAVPLLTADQEKAIFIQFNYARFKANELHQSTQIRKLVPTRARALIHWHNESERIRDEIVAFNLGLVLAMCRHSAASRLDYGEMVSEGNMALLRAADKFDVRRNFKFSTYACRAILKAFSRLSEKDARKRAMFPVSFDPAFDEGAESTELQNAEVSEYTSRLRTILNENRAGLTDRERRVIELRFALDDSISTTTPTLKDVGEIIGYSKERVRQIQREALQKLKQVMSYHFMEDPFSQEVAV